MRHYKNGKECFCRDTPTKIGIENYAEEHPNQEPNFNDAVKAAIHKSNTERVSSV